MQAIRAKNLPADRWTASKLNMMIQWHKRPDDSAMPSKKAEKLARYYEIYGCGEPVAPNILGLQPQEEHQEIPEPPPLPEPNLAAAADCNGRDADAVLLLMLAGNEGVSHVGNEFCQVEVVWFLRGEQLWSFEQQLKTKLLKIKPVFLLKIYYI